MRIILISTVLFCSCRAVSKTQSSVSESKTVETRDSTATKTFTYRGDFETDSSTEERTFELTIDSAYFLKPFFGSRNDTGWHKLSIPMSPQFFIGEDLGDTSAFIDLSNIVFAKKLTVKGTSKKKANIEKKGVHLFVDSTIKVAEKKETDKKKVVVNTVDKEPIPFKKWGWVALAILLCIAIIYLERRRKKKDD